MERHARETYQSVKVAVVIPLLQAGVSGMLLGAFIAALLYLLELSALVLMLSAVIAALVASVAWISGLRFWREMVSSVDGKIERIPLYSQVEPESGYLPEYSEPGRVRVELSEHGGSQVQYIDLPVSPDKLTALARGLVAGKPFTEGSWCGSGGIFSRGEFVLLRDEMVKRKLLTRNSPSTSARGYRLTRGGEAAIKYLATTTTPLLASGSDIGGF